MDNYKWDIKFLRLAREVSTWSKDPSMKVGCVLTLGKEIVSLGFNGFPTDIEDKEEWLNNREEKLKRMVHAEENALSFSLGRAFTTCYTYPVLPCLNCAKQLIQMPYLIQIVTINHPYNSSLRWNMPESIKLFSKENIQTTIYDENELG